MNIHGLFPTPVAFFKLDREFTKEENDFLLNQETRANEGNKTSKNNYVLNEKVNSNLKQFIEKATLEYFNTIYKPKHDVKPYITQSWLNYTKEGDFHHRHQHPCSFVSGVLYVQADVRKDKITFFDSLYKGLVVPASEYTIWNSSSWWLGIETGDLIIFPSRLTHAVEPVKGNRRASLSFNTFLKGYVGDDNDLTGLHL